MTYLFVNDDLGLTIERDFKVGECPREVKHQGRKFRRLFTAAIVIPNYMKAPGSTGSSADSNDENGAYLKSEAHRQSRLQMERVDARIEGAKASYAKAMKDAEPQLERVRKERVQKTLAGKKK